MSKFISTSKTRVFTAAGSPVLLGEQIDLTAEQQKEPVNQRLIDSGSLLEAKSARKKADPEGSQD